MDVCDLEMDAIKAVLLNQPFLHTFRCPAWLHTSPINMANLQLTFRYAPSGMVHRSRKNNGS